jgi:DNA repair protein RadC
MNIKHVFEHGQYQDIDIESSSNVPELKLAYQSGPISKTPLMSTEDQVAFLRQVFDPGMIELQESSVMLMLDDLHRPICYYRLSMGMRDSNMRDHLLMLQILAAVNPIRFILAHNHPGNVVVPSEDDIQFVMTFKRKCEYFGYDYFDEIIITKDAHYSFSDQNLIW